MPNNEIQDRLRELRDAWRYDEDTLARIDGDLRTIRQYVAVRQTHEELARAPKDEYDPIAVSVADSRRTAAHNRAIRAAGALNAICEACGIEPIAPVCPEGIDPYGQAHRTRVAGFAYVI